MIAKIIQAGVAAIVLISSTALPAAAHGSIRFETIYYDINGAVIGGIQHYCDRHFRSYGETASFAYSEDLFYGCPS